MKISIAHQNSYGTAVTAASSFMAIPVLGETFANEKPVLEVNNMRGVYDAQTPKEGPNSVSGGMEAEANPISLGNLLKTVLDTPTSTKANSASVYTHVFLPNSVDFDRFAANRPVTILKDFADGSSGDLMYDMIGSSLALSIANGELLKISTEFMGGKQGMKAAVSSTFEDVARAFTWDTTSVSLGGVAVEEILDLSVTIDCALTNRHTLNASKEPSRTKRDGLRSVAVEGNILFETMSHYLAFKNRTEQNLKLHLVGTGSEISSGYNDALTIECPSFTFDEFKPNASGPGMIEVPLKGRSTYNVGSGHSVKVTLVNTATAY